MSETQRTTLANRQVELDLHGAFMRRTSLRGANLRQANLQNADGSSADFSNANLEKANLRGGKFTDAIFRGANFQDAILDEADLRGADFTDAKNLTSKQLAKATIDPTTKLPNREAAAGEEPGTSGRSTRG